MSKDDPRSRAVDQVCTFLKNELGASAPPRSTVEAALGVYDEQRGAREPQLEAAPTSTVLPLLSGMSVPFTLHGGGTGEVTRLGDGAAIRIMSELQEAGVKLMRASLPT
jgi:hypothetical protein